MRALALVLAASGACGSGPRQVSSHGTPDAPRTSIVLDRLELTPQAPAPSTMYVTTMPSIDRLEPPVDAVLATDRAVGRKLVRELADSRAAIAKRRLDTDDRKIRGADIERLGAVSARVSDQLVDELGAHAEALTADGAWLLACVAAERSVDHYDTALSVYLDNPDAGVMPNPDFHDAIARIEAYAARFPDAHRGDARIAIGYLTIEGHRDDATLLAAGRDLVDVASAGTSEEIAYILATRAFIAASAKSNADIHALSISLRWLADHASEADRRTSSAAELGELLLKQRAPGVTDAYCRVVGDATLRDTAYARLATALVGDPDALAAACAAKACPCLPPVVDALAAVYAEVGDDDSARATLELGGRVASARVSDPKSRVRHLIMTGPVRRCLEPATQGDLSISIVIGPDELTRDVRVISSQLGERVATCILVALRRQRWTGLGDRDVVVPLHATLP